MNHAPFRPVLLLAALLGSASAARAEEAAITPYADLRYRLELVDQQGIEQQATASTIRVRAGVKTAEWNGLSAQVEGEAIQPIGAVAIKLEGGPLKSGEEVFKAQCGACHSAGLAGAPKFGDAAAWGPRIATGYETLLTSALKGKGAMGAQGGGDFSDLEVGRAVVYMANNSGGKLAEPAAPAAAADAASK